MLEALREETVLRINKAPFVSKWSDVCFASLGRLCVICFPTGGSLLNPVNVAPFYNEIKRQLLFLPFSLLSHQKTSHRQHG